MPFDTVDPDIQTLQEIRQLLKRRGAWCQYGEAIDKAGDEVDPTDESAVSFCLIGASKRVGVSEEKVAELLSFRDSEFMYDWNDKEKRQKRTVLRRIDEGIERRVAALKTG